MSDWFYKHLSELLPALYLEQDCTGDLKNFLKLPAAVLDEIKYAIDSFPAIFDVDRCDEKFLPLLVFLSGCQYNRANSVPDELQKIKETLEVYRRKGTLPALYRSLSRLGWQGRIEETFKQACRLNSRSRISASRLPGKLYSLGVYRLISDNQTDDVRKTVAFHHPAGTGVFFSQGLVLDPQVSEEPILHNQIVIQQLCSASLAENFIIGRTRLNQNHHLNVKNAPTGSMLLKSTSFINNPLDFSILKTSSFQGRQNRFKLNLKPLNGEKLVKCEINEINQTCWSTVYTGNDYQNTLAGSGYLLSRSRLNQKSLSYSVTADIYL